jgi:arginyl-tRNA synthetase
MVRPGRLPRLRDVTPTALADLVRSFAGDVLTRRGLDPATLPATITVERPRNPAHGDYATNVALATAPRAGVAPRELAGWLAAELAAVPGVRSAEVAGAGFLNLRLDPAAQGEIVRQVLAAGASYGIGDGAPRLHGPEVDRHSWPARAQVQYTHARLAALIRNAADLAVTSDGARLALLEHAREGELIHMLGDFPHVVASAERCGGPRPVLRYLEGLTRACHDFLDTCRLLPMGDEDPGPHHAARLALCQAARQVLAGGLGVLGVSAPERM